MKRLEKKIIAVAGGAGGISTGLSLRYAAEGASVVVGDINLAAAQAVVEQIVASGDSATAVALDIAEDDGVRDFVARCEEIYGGLDGLHLPANRPHVHPGRAHQGLNVQFGGGPRPEDFAVAVRALGEGTIDPGPWLGERVGLSGVGSALEGMRDPANPIRTIVDPRIG